MQSNKKWKCHICDRYYEKDDIFCNKCEHFRPLETFQNIVNHPKSASDFEIEFIQKRREMEK